MPARDVILFRWREAFCSSEGPPKPTTRLVLLILSLHMDMTGRDAFPSQQRIARMAGLSLRAAKLHLGIAERLGWIERAPRGRGAKQSYRFGTDYVPRFPLGGDSFGEPPAPMNGAPNATMTRTDGANGDDIGAQKAGHGALNAPSMVHDVPTNSSLTSSVELIKNTSAVCKKEDLPQGDILSLKAQELGLTQTEGEGRGAFALRVALADEARKRAAA